MIVGGSGPSPRCCAAAPCRLAGTLFRVPASGANSASHDYQLRQLANGKPEKTAELGIKEASFPNSDHSRSTTEADISRRKKLRPTARPRCLVDRTLHRSAEQATQQHSTPQLHQSQPLQFIVELRPVSRVSSGTSSLAADRRPLHFTAAQLYTAAIIAGETE